MPQRASRGARSPSLPSHTQLHPRAMPRAQQGAPLCCCSGGVAAAVRAQGAVQQEGQALGKPCARLGAVHRFDNRSRCFDCTALPTSAQLCDSKPLCCHCLLVLLCPPQTGTCAQGTSCPLAHSVFESWLHPSRFRTQLCCFGSSCKRRICFFGAWRLLDESPPNYISRHVGVLRPAVSSRLLSCRRTHALLNNALCPKCRASLTCAFPD